MTDSPRQQPDAESYGADRLALHLLGATQAAALACVPWVGRGDKEAADGAAFAPCETSWEPSRAGGRW